jgi:uncharacterized protein YlxW (UPF0749 family)
MSEENKTAEDELRDATWAWAGRIAMAAALIGTGFFAAYMQYGDAPNLRMQAKELQDRIVMLENDRETTNTRLAKAQRDEEVCQKEVKAMKKAAAAAAAPAAGN